MEVMLKLGKRKYSELGIEEKTAIETNMKCNRLMEVRELRPKRCENKQFFLRFMGNNNYLVVCIACGFEVGNFSRSG